MTNDIREQIVIRDAAMERRQADSMVRQLEKMTSPAAVKQVGIAARVRYEELRGIQPEAERRQFKLNPLMWLYLNISPYLLALLVVVPLIIALGQALTRRYGLVFLGQEVCPPLCDWKGLGLWIAASIVGTLGALVLGTIIRKGLFRLNR